MNEEELIYSLEGQNFHGHLVHDSSVSDKRPGVIVIHAWKGIDTFAKEKAKALAQLGYVGFSCDLYGDGKQATSNDEAAELMMPLFIDRALLQKRVISAYETLKKQEMVDPEKIGVIGFCFGGLSAIELVRSGTSLRGAVSFHGLLGDVLGENEAKTVPIAKKIQASLLMLHGHDDPLCPGLDVEMRQKELTDAGVDWQMVVYGNTMHAFTNPQANDVGSGLVFNQKASDRSWIAMKQFFREVFQ